MYGGTWGEEWKGLSGWIKRSPRVTETKLAHKRFQCSSWAGQKWGSWRRNLSRNRILNKVKIATYNRVMTVHVREGREKDGLWICHRPTQGHRTLTKNNWDVKQLAWNSHKTAVGIFDWFWWFQMLYFLLIMMAAPLALAEKFGMKTCDSSKVF